MTVQTDSRNEKCKADDVRNLSGGERSYTTFCLMLALDHVVRLTAAPLLAAGV